MKVYRMIEAFLLRCVEFFWRVFISVHEKKNIKKKQNLLQKVELTDAQKKQIDDFYLKNYGKKVPHKWHRLYQSYTGNFDYRYLPEPLLSTKLELLDNKRLQVLPMENKALLGNFTRGLEGKVRIPKTYVMCVQGRYYDDAGDVIDKETAIRNLTQLNGGKYFAICKKTVDTSSGRDVRLIEVQDGIDVRKNEKLQDVLASMGKNFIVQERLQAHPAFAGLYAGSINTLRVVTYQTKQGYKVAPIIIRIGKDGYVDNAHQGGMFVGVTEEGTLLKEAVTEFQQRYTAHPVTGVVFEGYSLPKVPEIRQCAIEMHKNYPSMRLISWDFTVDQDGNVVLIEANLHSHTIWMSQYAHGKGFFGEDTAEMLQLIRAK